MKELLVAIFGNILQSSVTAVVLVIVIFIVKCLLGKKFGVQWSHMIWVLLLIRLLMPYAPSSPVSIFNLFTKANTQIQFNFNATNEDVLNSGSTKSNTIKPSTNIQTNDVTPIMQKQKAPFSLTGLLSSINPWILSIIWAIGFILFAIHTIIMNLIFRHKVYRLSAAPDSYINELVHICKYRMGIKSNVTVLITSAVNNPALYGLFKPKLLIPPTIVKQLKSHELQYIILHELSHFRRKDLAVNWMICVLQMIHWFNPILWFAFDRMREDCEIACDALALSFTDAEDKKEYGFTIINLLEGSSNVIKPHGMMGLSSRKSKLKRRLTMISQYKKNTYRLSALALIVFIVIGAVLLTNTQKGVASTPQNVTSSGNNLDLPFVDDPQIIGLWESVDIVKNVEQFDPSNIYFKGDLYLKSLTFVKDGKMLDAPLTWTKGVIIQPVDKVVCKYQVKDINGSKYLFFEWKSGDYALYSQEPYYYVLKQIDSKDYSDKINVRQTDNIDLPFVDDPKIIGTWEIYDIVDSPEDFVPNYKNHSLNLEIKDFTFLQEGNVENMPWFSWTKGYVIHYVNQTASKYEIKEIDENTYILMELKNGDYTNDFQQPKTLVLKMIQ